MRDRALLAVLVTCALRRGELSRMNCDHLAMRDGRWVFLDFLGKGNKTRSVAVPLWVKQEIDGWLEVAGIEKGPILRRVLANGRVNVANPNVTRKIQYRHGMMRREDSRGVVTTASIADIANCETRGLRLP